MIYCFLSLIPIIPIFYIGIKKIINNDKCNEYLEEKTDICINNIVYVKLFFKNKYKYIKKLCIKTKKKKNLFIKDIYLINNNNVKQNILLYVKSKLSKKKILDIKSFNSILKYYNVSENKNNRILITYSYYNKIYKLYWTGNTIDFYKINKNYINNLKNYKIKNTNKSYYLYLINELNTINNIYYNTNTNNSKIKTLLNELNDETNNYLKTIFEQLKGPFNDYGYLLNCYINYKWIYNDFNLDKNKSITLNQGCILNELFEITSLNLNIKYEDEILLYNELKNKINKKDIVNVITKKNNIE